jgi:heme/copper-type cytochrome/quinol oxidase subunit 1
MTRAAPFVRTYALLVVGMAAIIAGVLLMLRGPATAPLGWTAYAPLSNTTFAPSFVSPVFAFGVAVLVAGAALVGGWVGFAFGRRPRSTV